MSSRTWPDTSCQYAKDHHLGERAKHLLVMSGKSGKWCRGPAIGHPSGQLQLNWTTHIRASIESLKRTGPSILSSQWVQLLNSEHKSKRVRNISSSASRMHPISTSESFAQMRWLNIPSKSGKVIKFTRRSKYGHLMNSLLVVRPWYRYIREKTGGQGDV